MWFTSNQALLSFASAPSLAIRVMLCCGQYKPDVTAIKGDHGACALFAETLAPGSVVNSGKQGKIMTGKLVIWYGGIV